VADDPRVGTVLSARYRIDRFVARGGFGAVYAAHDRNLGRTVAVKVLGDTAEGSGANRLAQFIAETRVLTNLSHPNIVAALDAGLAPHPTTGMDEAFLVMEWCEGETLKDDLAKRRGEGGRTVGEAWALLRPIAMGLAHAHWAGIAHRDLKPANVMLVPAPPPPGTRALPSSVSPRIIDFGLAKEVGVGARVVTGATETASAQRTFTPKYAAPEQLVGLKSGPWTDVHALGLLFTELVTDAPPYGGDEARLAVVRPERPTPRARGVMVGEALERVLAKALALQPLERFRTASDLMAALDVTLGLPTEPPRSAPPAPMSVAPATIPRAPLIESLDSSPPPSYERETARGTLIMDPEQSASRDRDDESR